LTFYFTAYHTKCIDPWLTKNRRVCPVCKRKVFAADERVETDSESDSDVDDSTPLIRDNVRSGTQGGTFTPQSENPFWRHLHRSRRRRHDSQSSDSSYYSTDRPVASAIENGQTINEIDDANNTNNVDTTSWAVFLVSDSHSING
jgi:E3 ubiquitin-protein ligase RNF13